MPNLNISNLNQGDSQEDIIRKVNNNFDSIVSNGGGPQGIRGKTGPQGPVGAVGPKGDPGQQGTRGTKWFIQSTEPLGGVSDPIVIGDYWADPLQDNKIFQYSSSGWVDTGETLKAQESFKLVEGISGPTGNKDAIVFSTPFPDKTTMVLSDSISTTTTANPTYSKLLISTNGANDYPLVEFAKTNASGIGTPADYNRHPQFRWLTPVGTTYDLLFTVPQDSLTLQSGGSLDLLSTNGDLNITSAGSTTFTSDATMKFQSTNGSIFGEANVFTVNSSNLFISTGSLQTNCPVTVTSPSNNYVMEIINTNTSNSAGGLFVDVYTTSTTTYLMDFKISGTRYFGVRADGRIEGSKMIQGTSTFTGNSGNSYGSAGGGGGTNNQWLIGYTRANNGNFLEATFVPGSGSFAYLVFNAAGLTDSWGTYLNPNTAMQLRIVYPGGSAQKINGLYVVKSGSANGQTPGSSATSGPHIYDSVAFSAGAVYADLVLYRGTTSSDLSIFYNNDLGDAGIISVT